MIPLIAEGLDCWFPELICAEKVIKSIKVQKISDPKIVKMLCSRGVQITKQIISAMWRKAFYIGVQTNSFVGAKAIKGNWEPLISEEEFLRVQNILDGNNQGYNVEKNNDSRPLIGTLYCPDCGK